jgi:uncharacterized membrane protein YdjX (TVP38/TMEM64 family)
MSPSIETTKARKPVRAGAIARALLVLAALALVGWLFASGAHRAIEPHALKTRILAFGAVGPLVFVLAFALVQPLGPSGHIFTVAASLVWSPPVAFALGLIGAVGAQTTAFAFYRYAASDWARARIPDRLLAYEDRLVARPFRSVLLIRLVSFTWPLVPPLLAVSRVRFAPMLAATFVGLAPGVALDVFVGQSLLAWLA